MTPSARATLKSVLVIEKDALLRQALRAALQQHGFEVSETTDGTSGLQMIRRTTPGCVVLAVDLDVGQNGYIICKKLKSDDELKNVPVIIIGDPDGFNQHQKLKTRADDYVAKPLSADLLIQSVKKLIGAPTNAALAREPHGPPSAAALQALVDRIGDLEERLRKVEGDVAHIRNQS